MSEQRACPGPCNGHYRKAIDAHKKALADYDPLDPRTSRPEPPSEQPWLGEPVWCAPCSALVSLRLAQLDTLAAMLAKEADGYESQPRTEKVGGSSEAGSPSPAADDLDELARMLAEWEDIYRGIKGWDSAPPRGDLASTETERVAWLGRHLRGILADPDIGPDFGTEVLQWHRGMKHQAKAGADVKPKPLRCPGCHLMTLVWEEGSDRVDCRNPDCARVFSYADYEKEVEHLALALARGETTREEEMA